MPELQPTSTPGQNENADQFIFHRVLTPRAGSYAGSRECISQT